MQTLRTIFEWTGMFAIFLTMPWILGFVIVHIIPISIEEMSFASTTITYWMLGLLPSFFALGFFFFIAGRNRDNH